MSPSNGQDRGDAAWPVALPQPREKERVLPLPSEHSRHRTRRYGPTYYNKNDTWNPRTPGTPGGRTVPTKLDYNYVRRRKDVTSARNPMPKPSDRQRNLKPSYSRVMHQWYLRNQNRKKVKQRTQYRTKIKQDPQARRYRQYYRDFPERFKRRGVSPFDTPAERTREWRKDRRDEARAKGVTVKEVSVERGKSKARSRKATTSWVTQLKDTRSPGALDRERSLRAPGLSRRPQPGLNLVKTPESYDQAPVVNVNNPGSGSGKVIPWNMGFTNNTQEVPQDPPYHYLRNNNFEVKLARTVTEILDRVDPQIKARASRLRPKLERTDTKNWIWTWRVGDHVVKVQAFRRGSSKRFAGLNLRISCSCPYWQWWGPEHWGMAGGYQRGKPRGTASVPRVRDPQGIRPVCKHAYAVLGKSKDFFVRPEKARLRRLGRYLSDISFTMLPGERRIAQAVARRYLKGL